jgi:hypothetical protein
VHAVDLQGLHPHQDLPACPLQVLLRLMVLQKLYVCLPAAALCNPAVIAVLLPLLL